MVKLWIKFLQKIDKNISYNIYQIVEKILSKNFENLDIKKLKWKENLYRCRCGDIRIIYFHDGNTTIIEKIWFRGDVYK